jgi:hypothetical protein
MLGLCIAKTINDLLCLFYFYGRYTVCAQHVGDMIAERVRYKQHAGREIRPYPNGNYRIPMDGGQLYLPSHENAEAVGILLADFNKTIRKELSLRLRVAT